MHKKNTIARVLLSLGLAVAALAASAQAPAEPRNIVQLSANGTVEAQQDWLTVTLATSRDGSDAAAVQANLRQALESALSEVKKTAAPGAMEVHSGGFTLQPRYSNDGKINGWSGSAELVLEGSDFARIGTAASQAQPMTIRGLDFSLSRQTTTRLEAQAQALAIDNFKQKASQIAHGFGFADYVLREVMVTGADQAPHSMPLMDSNGAAPPPLPMESGRSLVVVQVSGAVQLK